MRENSVKASHQTLTVTAARPAPCGRCASIPSVIVSSENPARTWAEPLARLRRRARRDRRGPAYIAARQRLGIAGRRAGCRPSAQRFRRCRRPGSQSPAVPPPRPRARHRAGIRRATARPTQRPRANIARAGCAPTSVIRDRRGPAPRSAPRARRARARRRPSPAWSSGGSLAIASARTKMPLRSRSSPMNTKSAASAPGATGTNSSGGHAIVDDRDRAFRHDDLPLVGRLGEVALEDDRVGARHHRPLDRHEGDARRRSRREMQHPAVRRVDRDLPPRPREPGIEPALRAMAMQHVDAEIARETSQSPAAS